MPSKSFFDLQKIILKIFIETNYLISNIICNNLIRQNYLKRSKYNFKHKIKICQDTLRDFVMAK